MKEEPEPHKPSAMEFVKARLSLSPEASFAEIKAQAKVEGILVYPVVYGRAKALLGLVPTAPYGSKSKTRQKPEPEPAPEMVELETPVERGDGKATSRAKRARKAIDASSDHAFDLEDMISSLKAAVRERDRYRSVLEKLAELVKAELRK